MFRKSLPSLRTVLAALAAALLAGAAVAEPGDGVTVGDVAAMEPRKAISYIYREASQRVLEVGKLHGDAVLRCLDDEFVEITEAGDGTHNMPRGLIGAVKLIHRHNNNGGEARPAADQIVSLVDLVAERVCGAPAPAGTRR